MYDMISTRWFQAGNNLLFTGISQLVTYPPTQPIQPSTSFPVLSSQPFISATLSTPHRRTTTPPSPTYSPASKPPYPPQYPHSLTRTEPSSSTHFSPMASVGGSTARKPAESPSRTSRKSRRNSATGCSVCSQAETSPPQPCLCCNTCSQV